MNNDVALNQKSLTYRILYYVFPFVSIIAFLVFWQVISSSERSLLPSPMEVAERLVVVFQAPVAKTPMISHILVSMKRVFGSLAIAVLIGVPFGIFLGWYRTFRAIFKPIFEIIRPIPPIAWVPLITVWFGTGEFPKMLIVFLGVFMPIVVNSYAGVEMVPPLNFEVGRVFGANRNQLLFDVVLPSSLSAIFAGIRTGLGTGWMVLLAAEMISAKSGLGFLIMQGSNANDLTLSIVAMVFIGLMGAFFAYGFDYVERWLCPWKRK